MKKVSSSLHKILQHISLEIKIVFNIQGIAFIPIFLFQDTAFQIKLVQVSFVVQKKKTINCREEKSKPPPPLDIEWSAPCNTKVILLFGE